MTMVSCKSVVDSKIGALDAAHFKGALLRTISEFERVDVIEVQHTGARAGNEIFVRSKFPDWASHPALGPMLEGLGEKGEKLGAALAASPGYTFHTSGSDRVFTSLAHVSGGRNVPPAARRSQGLFDVDHFAIGSVSKASNQTYSLVAPASDAAAKLAYVDVYALHTRLAMFIRKPATTLIAKAAWAAMSELDRQTQTAAGKREATDLEDQHIKWFANHVVEVADRTAALAVTTKALALITGQPLARLVKLYNGTAAQGGLPVDEYCWFSMTGNCHANTAPLELDRFGHTTTFMDAAIAELNAKGFRPTGMVRCCSVTPSAIAPATYTFATGVVTNPVSVYPNDSVISRHGTSTFAYAMWNIALLFEVVGEHPNDVIWHLHKFAGGVSDVQVEKYVMGMRSSFNGGVTSTPQNTAANLTWYLSSVDLPWHTGAPDPLASVDLAAVTMASEQTVSGALGHRLLSASLRSLRSLGSPRFYLPLFAVLGNVEVLYRVPRVTVGSYMAVAHHDFPLDESVEIGRYVIDAIVPTVNTDPVLYDPDAVPVEVVPPTTPSEINTFVGGCAVISCSLLLESDRYCGSADGAWMGSTAFTGFGLYKPVSDKEASAITAFLPQLSGKSVAFASYDGPIGIRSKIVESTDLYREYKKSREKACKVNDFMRTSFHGKLTWGQAQENVDRQRSLRVLYGLFDPPTLVDESVPVSSVGVTFNYVAGSIPAQLRRTKAGSPDRVLTAKDSDELFAELSRGATLSGILLTTLSASWNDGVSEPNMSAEVDAMKAGVTLIDSKKDGSRVSTGGASLNWSNGSFNVNGYPLVEQMLYQDALKAVICSVNLHSQVGAVFKAAMERTGEALISASIVRGKRHLANSPDPIKFFEMPVT